MRKRRGEEIDEAERDQNAVTASLPKPRSMPIRSRKLNIIACVSAMQLMPATPNHTAGAGA